jgi:hypothetical protein
MRRLAAFLLAALVLVPASAGAGTTRPPLGLTATPAHVALAGSSRATIRVTNPGLSPVVVDVARAGFSLDLRGRPKIVARGDGRAASAWVTARPARFVLGAGASRSLTVSSQLPLSIEPGDHDALVLLTTRPRRGTGVAVRMRIGIVVVVRAPGRIVRRLALGRLRVRRHRGLRVIELDVANRGNVTESLERGDVRLTLRRGSGVTQVRADPRDLRPRTGGIAQFRYRGPLQGWVTATARIALEPGRPLAGRTYRVKL